MDAPRKLLVALLLVAVSLTSAACSASGEVDDGGLNAEIEGEGGGEGGGDD